MTPRAWTPAPECSAISLEARGAAGECSPISHGPPRPPANYCVNGLVWGRAQVRAARRPPRGDRGGLRSSTDSILCGAARSVWRVTPPVRSSAADWSTNGFSPGSWPGEWFALSFRPVGDQGASEVERPGRPEPRLESDRRTVSRRGLARERERVGAAPGRFGVGGDRRSLFRRGSATETESVDRTPRPSQSESQRSDSGRPRAAGAVTQARRVLGGHSIATVRPWRITSTPSARARTWLARTSWGVQLHVDRPLALLIPRSPVLGLVPTHASAEAPSPRSHECPPRRGVSFSAGATSSTHTWPS